MLRRIRISFFKCFEHLDLSLGQLTLLSGLNGGGKSSVIQALVLLHQTLTEREWGHKLLLDGPQLALGSVADVINQRSGRRSLSLGASTDDEIVLWTFSSEDRRVLAIDLEGVAFNSQAVAVDDIMHWLLPAGLADKSDVVKALRSLHWITAERTGPREILPLRDEDSHWHVGRFGELAAGLVHWRSLEEVDAKRCIANIPNTMFQQVKGHMQLFFPGFDFRVTPIEGASSVTLHLRTNSSTDFQRPQNVGFGLTQIFPVVVSLLAAGPGDLLVIENPEIHLHPRAQQDIGRLVAQTAAAGVQVIVETHSDHVLNGIRLAVKDNVIPSNHVAIHFFSPPAEGEPYEPLSPKMDSDGRLDAWPDGFFDQMDLALSQLL